MHFWIRHVGVEYEWKKAGVMNRGGCEARLRLHGYEDFACQEFEKSALKRMQSKTVFYDNIFYV